MPGEGTCARCGQPLAAAEAAADAVWCASCQAVAVAPEPAAAPAAAPPPALLPETMLANRAIAGRICPACGKPAQIGVPVHNCPGCGTTHHETCWTEGSGCAASPCRSRATAAPTEATAPCPHCGEPVGEEAVTCPHCGESLREFPVTFDRGRDRLRGAQGADIRRRDGVIRLTGEGLEIEGRACASSTVQLLVALVFFIFLRLGVILAFILMEYVFLTKKKLTYGLDDVVRAVFERDKRHLLIGVRTPAKKAVTWYRCRSARMEELRAVLAQALGAGRMEERNSWENVAMAEDLAFNWSLAAVLLPIPFLGFLFSFAAAWHVVKLRRLTGKWPRVAAALAGASVLGNLGVVALILSR